MRLAKKLLNHFRDYFHLTSPKLKAQAIDRALSKDLADSRVFNRTPAENLMHFLHIFGRDQTAEHIRALVASNDYSQDTFGYEYKIKTFLMALIKTSHEVFDIDLSLISCAKSLYTHEDIINYYKENNLDNDLQKIWEYKKKLNAVFKAMGYQQPTYVNFYPDTIEDKDLTDDSFISKFCTSVVIQANSNRSQSEISICKISKDFKIVPNYNIGKKDEKSLQLRKTRNRLFNVLLIVSIMVGITESFLPYFFVFDSIEQLHLSRSVIVSLSTVAFISAFLVSSLVFHNGGLSALEDLYFKPKSVLLYDEKGKKLSSLIVAKNFFAIFLAIIASITLTGLSFSFYSKIFPINVAYGFVIANLIGWTGLLTTAVISVLNKKTFDDIKFSLYDLLFNPIINLLKDFSIKNFLFNSASLILNAFVVTAIIFISFGVIMATYVLFVSALRDVISNSGSLSIYFSPDDAFYITIAAMIPLSIFMVKNISRIINFIRTSTLDSLQKIYKLSRMKKNYSMRNETAAYRKKATRFRNKLAFVFAICSLINGLSGSAGLYTNSAVAESVIQAAMFFGIAPEYVPAMITASIFAAIANLFASIGNTMFPAVNSVIYDRPMNYRRQDFADKYFKDEVITSDEITEQTTISDIYVPAELHEMRDDSNDGSDIIITDLNTIDSIEQKERPAIIEDISDLSLDKKDKEIILSAGN